MVVSGYVILFLMITGSISLNESKVLYLANLFLSFNIGCAFSQHTTSFIVFQVSRYVMEPLLSQFQVRLLSAKPCFAGSASTACGRVLLAITSPNAIVPVRGP
ncbi:hypothetical protein EDB19DRAFT_551022 [Suillus lakei]|nr:hypothetical protein EDB19DRAFT_551022 [Suillus lakei]